GRVVPEGLGAPLEGVRGGGPGNSARRTANPVGAGTIWVAVFPMGLPDPAGQFAAFSSRPDFPTDLERLVLRAAADQAMIALQEARRLTELRRSAEELDRKVAERTAQLTAVHQALNVETLVRERGEKALAETEAR